MTIDEFVIKWNVRFATNDTFEIDEADFREFKDDIAQFLQAGPSGTPALSELVLPQPVIGGNLYLTSTAIWAARSSFTASAPPMPGPNWRLVVSFGQVITAASITDASAAGRSLLTAASASVQLGLLDVLDIKAGQEGNHPAFTRAYQADGLLLFLLKKVMQPAAVPVVQQPDAPTDGQVDDKGDTYSFKPTAANPSFAQYQVSGLPLTTGAEWLNAANCYVQNGRIYIRVVGAVDAGGLAVFVGPSGAIPAGRVLTNDKPFTANNVAPTVPGALAVIFTVGNANLSPGDTLTFSAKASGGTAPYAHAVQALNPDTGVVTVLGTTNTPNFIGNWPKVPAGVYLVTDAVTDAAGSALVSETRRVVVAAPGSGSGTLVPATTTRLGGIKVGARLSIDDEGNLSVDNLLESANRWKGANYFEKGIQLYNGAGFDEYGQLKTGQIIVGDNFSWRTNVQKMARAALIGWSPDEYVGQANGPDVGLGRSAAGVLEVNTGTAGQRATLRVLDLVADAAPAALNTFIKIAGAIGTLSALATTAKTSVVAALNELLTRIPLPGLGLAQVGYTIGLTKTVKNIPLGPSVVGLISDADGTLIDNNDFAKGYLASGFLGVEAGTTITFGGSSAPQFSAYYDAKQVYLRAVGMYQDPYLNQVPPGAAYVRFSYPKAQFPTQVYTLGRLPYVRSVNGSFPDADGNVLVQASTPSTATYFTTTYAVQTAGVQTLTAAQVPGLVNATAVLQVCLVSADGTLDPELAEDTGFTFDATNRVLKLLAGTQTQGDYFQPGTLVRIKYLTGAIVPGSADLATPGGTVLVFTQDAEYAPIYSGTFTVDLTGAKAGKVVFIELGPAATAPTLDPTRFELEGGRYYANQRLGYAFRVTATGKIRYIISLLP